MPKGIVKFFNHKARFGFIKDNDSGNEIYTRKSRLIDEVSDGDHVEYTIEPGRKGDEAVDVKLLQKAAESSEENPSEA